MKKGFLRTVYLPALLALPLTLAMVLFTDVGVESQKLKVEVMEDPGKEGRFLYHNIDGVPGNELLRAYDLHTNAALLVYKDRDILYEAWKLPGFWFNEPDFYLDDLDNDGIQEMYALTVNEGDSLLITRFPLARRNFEMETRFVCTLGRYNKRFDQHVAFLGSKDICGSEHPEVMFQVSAGFTLQPRAIYAWDLEADSIIRSPFTGQNQKYVDKLMTPEEFSRHPFVYGFTASTDNYQEAVPYSDTASYAMVLKRNLEYLFEPMYMGGPQSYTQTFPFRYNNEPHVLALSFERRKSMDPCTLHVLALDGTVVDQKTSGELVHGFRSVQANGRIVVSMPEGDYTRIATITEALEFQVHHRLEDLYHLVRCMNVDKDPDSEFILISADGLELGILQEDLKTFTHVHLDKRYSDDFFKLSLMAVDDFSSVLFAKNDPYEMQLTLLDNRLYALRIVYYLGLFLTFTAAFIFLQWLFSRAARRRYHREQKLLDYQLQSVMNQLNPHFTFNAINSIGDAIMAGRKEEAFDYFAKLSNLIRKSMKNAIHPFKTLGEELAFVEEYLEIESYRFGDKLSWTLECDPQVDRRLTVPKMLIHIFVENAIKHGVFHLERPGAVGIYVSQGLHAVHISITDNGVGFDRAQEIEGQQGQGLKIMQKYIKLYNRQEKRRITFEILDRMREEGESGTRVEIRIT